jgi:ABC-type Na+ efflux pump permease subunit
MKTQSCCRRVVPRTVSGTMSAVLLVLMPKCPICLAAYLSVATGVGIGLTTAKYLRIGLIALCVVSLLWVSVPLWRLGRRSFGHHN